MAETTYFNGFNCKESKFGIKFSGKAENIIAEIQKYTNSKGYINLEMVKRRETGKYGETHTIKVDTWEPTNNASKQVGNAEYKAPEVFNGNQGGDDLPF